MVKVFSNAFICGQGLHYMKFEIHVFNSLSQTEQNTLAKHSCSDHEKLNEA